MPLARYFAMPLAACTYATTAYGAGQVDNSMVAVGPRIEASAEPKPFGEVLKDSSGDWTLLPAFSDEFNTDHMVHALQFVTPIVSSGTQPQLRKLSIVLGFNTLSETRNAIRLVRSPKVLEKTARYSSDEVCNYCAVSTMGRHSAGKDRLDGCLAGITVTSPTPCASIRRMRCHAADYTAAHGMPPFFSGKDSLNTNNTRRLT